MSDNAAIYADPIEESSIIVKHVREDKESEWDVGGYLPNLTVNNGNYGCLPNILPQEIPD